MAIGVVLLGAGLSSRMEGRCKGLLPWRSGRIIDAVMAAYGAVPHKVAVVGSHEPQLQELLRAGGYDVVVNEDPTKGQGVSLRLGVERLIQLCHEREVPLDGVLCAVSDQPCLTAEVVEQVIHGWEGGKGDSDREYSIVVPFFGPKKVPGNPVLFGCHWLESLRKIQGDTGGRHIWRQEGASYVKEVWLQDDHYGGEDVDTPESYQRLYDIRGRI